MVKKILLLAALVLPALFGQAQDLQPLPLNPKVKSGVLSNGMHYYILHNEEPKGKANFYIAQKVGSTLEEPNQLGLAHFLEHMAFNGTTNYPGKDLLNYLQSKGIRFGADINAGTGYDQTVYNINNVPTADTNLMDSVLIALRDWSCGILLDAGEIEEERGVILEEKRMTEDAMERMFNKLLPVIYKEYPYQHTIIGTEEVIKNFTQAEIRDYYHKWYRPDLQGIIIVGDFNADEMAQKVEKLFSTIEMPANAPERVYTSISHNEKPIFGFYQDPEAQAILTLISFKDDAIPFEFRNTAQVYVNQNIVQQVIAKLINDRLEEFTLDPACNYSYAGVSFGNFLISKTADAFTIQVVSKNNAVSGVSDAMGIIARACKTGFTESEYTRAKDALMANIEKFYNERDKTSNAALASELCRHFLDNEAAPGIETEYELFQTLLPQLPLSFINELCPQLLTPNDMVIVTMQPSNQGLEVVTEDVMVGTVTNAMNAEYEAYQEEAITEPLIAQLPSPGSISSTSEDEELGLTCYTLSNGVEVVVKPTDFAADEILLTAVKKGGKNSYNVSESNNVLMMGDVYENSKMGPFNQITLSKYLAGKKVALGFDVNNFSTVLKGSSTVKDLPVLMELIYTSFTNINPDPEGYSSYVEKYRPLFANLEKKPEFIFQQACDSTEFEGNKLMMPPTMSTLVDTNYDKTLNMLKEALSNPADYTFIFTGNVDLGSFENLMLQYLGSLTTSAPSTVTVVTPIEMAKGDVVNHFEQQMQTPATYIKTTYSGYDMEYTTKNAVMINLLGQILQNNYIETLREEVGGTYSPFAYATYNNGLNCWTISSEVITNAEKQQEILDRSALELNNILTYGVDAVNFNKVKEAAVQQNEIQKKNNRYWNTYLMIQNLYPEMHWLSEYEPALLSITLEDFNAFIKTLNDKKNCIQIIMEGVSGE